MQVRLRFFASVREAIGVSQETVVLPSDVVTVGQVRSWLAGRGDPWAEALAPARALRTALNQQMCDAGTPVVDQAEVAFFPPVTGG